MDPENTNKTHKIQLELPECQSSGRCLMGSRLIGSFSYWDKKYPIYQSQITFLFLVHSLIVIIPLMESVWAWPKVIPLAASTVSKLYLQ
jgi:hypothetical protein